MYQRIKQLRESIPLSQTAFGKKMGVSRDVINNIEQDRNKKPVSELFISHLCETFNVNETWLRTGMGDMFIPIDTSSLSALKKEYNLSQKATAILENFLNLSDKEQDEFINLAEKVFNENTAHFKEKPTLYSVNNTMAWAADDTKQTRPEIIHEEIKNKTN